MRFSLQVSDFMALSKNLWHQMLNAAGESYFHQWNLAQCTESGHISDSRRCTIWFLFTANGSARADGDVSGCLGFWVSGKGAAQFSLVTWLVNNTWLVCGTRPRARNHPHTLPGPWQWPARDCPHSGHHSLESQRVVSCWSLRYFTSVFSHQCIQSWLGSWVNPLNPMKLPFSW